MKKLFLILTATGVMLVTLTAKGNFESVATLEGTSKFTLTKVKAISATLKNGTDEAKDRFVDVLNIQNLQLKTTGDTKTGAGYTYTAIYQNAFNKTQYALVTITTNDWLTANVTAEMCDAEGNLPNKAGSQPAATKEDATTGHKPEEAHITTELLQKAVETGAATGTTTITPEALQKAFMENESITVAVTLENKTAEYSVGRLEKPAANTWNGTFVVDEKEYGVELVNTGAEVNFNITAKAAAAAAV